jgi:hypothetical protein
MTVSASVRVALSVSQTGANAFSGGPNWSGAIDEILSFTNGTGANQCDLAYVAERTVASATNDDIDLAGVLTDALGATIIAAELVALLIINKQKDGTANTTDLTIGLGTNPVLGFLGGTLPTIGPLKPGAMILLASPGAAGLGVVGAGASDVLRIANSSGAQAKYLIAALARSA